KSPWVRAWTVQLALEGGKADDKLLSRLAEMAREDDSPVVRLYLASGLQRLPADQRWAVLEGLVAHVGDSADHNLPLMYWYAAEPLADADARRALELAAKAKVQPLLQFMARRVGSAGTPEAVGLVVDRLAAAEDAGAQLAVLRGLSEGLKGRKQVKMPE